ncbi:hypothetical protein RISK_003380 [Rhodopirellula islandica]|uniref:Uncharacterized protein n=1 Tax=Rhodopirellula islandica TaxID=595434 RepID=A0A0J1BCS7_RHOIS|nr:hypothetical protein RISK_003380 [Rhodopirellula islandica]
MPSLFPSILPSCEKSFGQDARIHRQEAITMFNSQKRKFPFLLNQDNV